MRCEILSSDIATARISIAAPDLVELLERVGQNADSIEECGYLILEAIESENYQVRTTELNVRIDEFGNPSDSYAFYDAIYGGILTHLDRYFADESEGVA